MERNEAIEYLEKLEKGNFLTVNMPIFRNDIIHVTAMYVGKDKEGNYNFVDTGKFKLTKEFLNKGKISINKEYNGDIAIDIHAKFRMEEERKRQKHKRRKNTKQRDR